MDLRKANLSQLQYIARYTNLRNAALNEFTRRVLYGEAGHNQTEKKTRGRTSYQGFAGKGI